MKTTDNKKRRYPVGGRKSNGKWLPSDSGSFSFTQQQKNSLSTAWRVAATNTAKRKQVDGYIELVEKDIRLQNQINAVNAAVTNLATVSLHGILNLTALLKTWQS